jgi:KDO2-lipid IV(A) lauroyltransferase
MKAFIYYLSLPFIYLISLLPFGLLYTFSDFLFFLFYRLIGYRKEVVFRNLQHSFPEKSEAELKKIQIKFYQYFFDLALETVKSLTISPKNLTKRVSFEDTSIFKKHFGNDQSIIIVMGHYGNWELGGARFALEPFHKLYVVYHPLSNKYFDQLMYKMRTRFGNGLYPMRGTLRGMVGNRKQVTATAFIADQTPSPHGAYWMDFLHQDTPVFTGTGKIANKFNYPVVYASVKRGKRGYYTIHLEELCTTSKEVDPEEIVARFTKRLEQDIREMPEFWLWTHRRWKHKRQPQTNQDSDA